MKCFDKLFCLLLFAVGLLTHSNLLAASEANRLELSQEVKVDIGATEFQLPILLTNEVPLTGFQCDLYLPNGFSVAKDEYGDDLIDIARTTFNRHSLATRNMPDGALRIVLSSMTNATFAKNDGVVLNLTIIKEKAIGAGNYLVELKNIILTDPRSERYTSEDDSGYIVINEVEPFKLIYLVDGKEYQTFFLNYGERITPLSEPTKEGYTFSGWSEIPETMPAHDVTITGKFSVNQYKVTFIADDKVVTETTQDFGSEILIPVAPEKEGHTFSTWGRVESTMPAHDVSYIAEYIVNTYFIRYYVDGQLFAVDEVMYGAEVVFRDYTPEDTARYSFTGWAGEVYSTMPAHDINYYANIADCIFRLSSTLNDVEAVYDANGLNGKKLNHGVNLLLMHDGSVRKLAVK